MEPWDSKSDPAYNLISYFTEMKKRLNFLKNYISIKTRACNDEI